MEILDIVACLVIILVLLFSLFALGRWLWRAYRSPTLMLRAIVNMLRARRRCRLLIKAADAAARDWPNSVSLDALKLAREAQVLIDRHDFNWDKLGVTPAVAYLLLCCQDSAERRKTPPRLRPPRPRRDRKSDAPLPPSRPLLHPVPSPAPTDPPNGSEKVVSLAEYAAKKRREKDEN